MNFLYILLLDNTGRDVKKHFNVLIYICASFVGFCRRGMGIRMYSTYWHVFYLSITPVKIKTGKPCPHLCFEALSHITTIFPRVLS